MSATSCERNTVATSVFLLRTSTMRLRTVSEATCSCTTLDTQQDEVALKHGKMAGMKQCVWHYAVHCMSALGCSTHEVL